MHSPGATGQEEHDSQTLSTGVHLSCLSVSADNPSPGHRIREVKDNTAKFNHYGRRLSTITLAKYVCGILLLCRLLMYDQQEQRRRWEGHYFFAILSELHGLAHMPLALGLATPEQSQAGDYFHPGGDAGSYTN